MTNDEIIELAALGLMPEIEEDEALARRFEEGLGKLSQGQTTTFMLAYKLLEKGKFWIQSDDPESLQRCRSIADAMGASVKRLAEDRLEFQLTHDRH